MMKREYLLLVLVSAVFLNYGCSDLVGDPFDESKLNEAELNQVISEGLKAWRKQGTILGGAACANCHSPDALDLAYFDFDANTIRRLGEHHTDEISMTLTESDLTKIIKLVLAQRAKFGIEPRDPVKDRPLQPGGKVLPGETAIERDLAFGRQLTDNGYRFATIPVLDEEEAILQRDEWLSIDPRRLQIGIPLNRWSENKTRGLQHATLADWLPALPRIPREGKEMAWYAVHDAYLENPTDENLWELLKAEGQMTKSIYSGNSSYFFHQKYRSVLIAQHLFRQEVIDGILLTDRPASSALSETGKNSENPVWEIGMLAHAYKEGTVGTENFQIPEEVRNRLHPTGTIAEDMHRIRVPWFYAGWLLDQGLQHSGEREDTRSARYFTQHLHTDDGYPIHNIFMITRKMVVQNYDWPAGTSGAPLIVDYDNFNNWELAMSYEPVHMAARKIYRFVTENSYRMFLFLIKKEIADNGLPSGSDRDEFIQEKWKETVDDFEAFAEHADTDHYEFNMKLVNETRNLFNSDPDS